MPTLRNLYPSGNMRFTDSLCIPLFKKQSFIWSPVENCKTSLSSFFHFWGQNILSNFTFPKSAHFIFPASLSKPIPAATSSGLQHP